MKTLAQKWDCPFKTKVELISIIFPLPEGGKNITPVFSRKN